MSASTVYPIMDQNQYKQEVSRMYSAPSKLIQMQAAYRQKLYEEKERKMTLLQQMPFDKTIEYTADNRQNSLVRDFFLERRILQKSREHLPEINQHYRLKKLEYDRQQHREHSFPLVNKKKAISEPSVANTAYTNDDNKNEKFVSDRPPKSKNSNFNANQVTLIKRKQQVRTLATNQLEQQYDNEIALNQRKHSNNATRMTENANKNDKNHKNMSQRSDSVENDKASENLNENELTPIELAKLHQLKRRKLTHKSTYADLQTDDDNMWSESNSHNNKQVNNNPQDDRQTENVMHTKVQSAGKVSSFKKWQQEQETRRKALLADHGTDDKNRNDRNEQTATDYQLKHNEKKSERQISLQQNRYDRGTGGDSVLNNVKWGSVPRNGRKIENEPASNKTDSLKEKKLAILKKQNLKLNEEHSDLSNKVTYEHYDRVNNRENSYHQTLPQKPVNDTYRMDSDEANNLPIKKPKIPQRKLEQANFTTTDEYNTIGSQSNNNYNTFVSERKPSATIQRKSSRRRSTPQINDQYRESAEMYVRVAEIQQQKEGDTDIKLAECVVCGRKFAADRLQTHMKVCRKSTLKQRKVFDPVKMRTKGTEQEKFIDQRASTPEKPKTSQWRKQHEDFIKTLRYAKQAAAAGAKGIDIGPPPVSQNPDYVGCPHCGRRFNKTAAERHIPKCKDIKSRPPPPPKYKK